jgi:hypothetical protein
VTDPTDGRAAPEAADGTDGGGDRPPEEAAPDFAGATDHVLAELVQFARDLRVNGVTVPADAGITAAQAIVQVGFDDRERVRAALRSVFVSDEGDIGVYEDLFPRFWYRLRMGLETAARGHQEDDDEEGPQAKIEQVQAHEAETDEEGQDLGSMFETTPARETPDEEPEEFESQSAAYSPEGESSRAAVDRMGYLSEYDLDRFVRALAGIRGRRWTSTPSGDRFDARRALRESVQTGGTALGMPTRDRKPTELRACVLVDVSRSILDVVDRSFLLEFLDRLQSENRSVRTFFFDTDLQEVTDAFDNVSESPGEALERARVEWGGGTRIGQSLGTLRREYPYAVDRRTVVVIISDGVDTGDIGLLEEHMVDLYRGSRAVLWLNPLASSAAYEPACRGMEVALPFVDGLFAFSRAEDVVEIARQLEQRGLHGAVGYEYDPRRRRSADSGPAEGAAGAAGTAGSGTGD